MRSGPFDRLDRTLPGDALVLREAAAVRVRRPGKIASAGPNAPLLMRIVRSPYRLATGRPTRVVYYVSPERFTRVDPAAERAGATTDREREPSRSPAGRRARPFTVRPSRLVLMPPEDDAS
jgi:hypothetical protein